MRRGFAASHLSSFKLNEEKHEQTLQIRSGVASLAVTASGVASAQSYPNTVDNWRNPFGNV